MYRYLLQKVLTPADLNLDQESFETADTGRKNGFTHIWWPSKFDANSEVEICSIFVCWQM